MLPIPFLNPKSNDQLSDFKNKNQQDQTVDFHLQHSRKTIVSLFLKVLLDLSYLAMESSIDIFLRKSNPIGQISSCVPEGKVYGSVVALIEVSIGNSELGLEIWTHYTTGWSYTNVLLVNYTYYKTGSRECYQRITLVN